MEGKAHEETVRACRAGTEGLDMQELRHRESNSGREIGVAATSEAA